jgi:hypothetical protein
MGNYPAVNLVEYEARTRLGDRCCTGNDLVE